MNDQPFRLEVMTAREIAALPDPPDTDLLVGPFVRRDARTIIVGDTGHGKTALAAQFVRAVLTGEEVFGYEAMPTGPVLIVDLEQGLRTIKRMLRELGLDDRDDLLYVACPDGLALDTNADHLAELHRVVDEHRPAVVCLDPFYKAHRGDPNEERPIVDLMRILDALRAKYGFALILPAHPRKDATSHGVRRLTLHDVAGSGAIVRGAELVIGIERLNHGYARLRILKDRDGDLPVGDAWGLLYDRDQGFRRDPADDAPPRDLAAEIEAFLLEHPSSTTNETATGVKAGRAKVSETLKTDPRFTFEKGPNKARLWVARSSETHSGHLFTDHLSGGGPVGGPLIGATTQAIHPVGGPDDEATAYYESLAETLAAEAREREQATP